MKKSIVVLAFSALFFAACQTESVAPTSSNPGTIYDAINDPVDDVIKIKRAHRDSLVDIRNNAESKLKYEVVK